MKQSYSHCPSRVKKSRSGTGGYAHAAFARRSRFETLSTKIQVESQVESQLETPMSVACTCELVDHELRRALGAAEGETILCSVVISKAHKCRHERGFTCFGSRDTIKDHWTRGVVVFLNEAAKLRRRVEDPAEREQRDWLAAISFLSYRIKRKRPQHKGGVDEAALVLRIHKRAAELGASPELPPGMAVMAAFETAEKAVSASGVLGVAALVELFVTYVRELDAAIRAMRTVDSVDALGRRVDGIEAELPRLIEREVGRQLSRQPGATDQPEQQPESSPSPPRSRWRARWRDTADVPTPPEVATDVSGEADVKRLSVVRLRVRGYPPEATGSSGTDVVRLRLCGVGETIIATDEPVAPEAMQSPAPVPAKSTQAAEQDQVGTEDAMARVAVPGGGCRQPLAPLRPSEAQSPRSSELATAKEEAAQARELLAQAQAEVESERSRRLEDVERLVQAQAEKRAAQAEVETQRLRRLEDVERLMPLVRDIEEAKQRAEAEAAELREEVNELREVQVLWAEASSINDFVASAREAALLREPPPTFPSEEFEVIEVATQVEKGAAQIITRAARSCLARKVATQQEKGAAHKITQAARSYLTRMSTHSFASPVMESRRVSGTPTPQASDADVMEQLALFFDLEMSCDEDEDLATALALSLFVADH